MSTRQLAGIPGFIITLIDDSGEGDNNSRVQEISHKGLNVCYGSGHNPAGEDGLLYVDECLTTISPVDGQSKFSTGYAQCIGVAAIGEANAGGRLSMLLHANPDSFFSEYRVGKRAIFREHLQGKLKELVGRCKTGSVKTVIFAGEAVPHWLASERVFRRRTNFLSSAVEQITGSWPTVLLPKFERPFNSRFYLDTQAGHAVLVQPWPETDGFRPFFPANRLECEFMRWRVAVCQKPLGFYNGCHVTAAVQSRLRRGGIKPWVD